VAKRLTIPDTETEVFALVLDNGLNTPLYELGTRKLSDEFVKYLTDWIEEYDGSR
jgi:hypothetical protein